MEKKLVFIGNSIVNGFPYERNQCFASLVEHDTGYTVVNRGINGDTSSNILSRFSEDVLSEEPDAVFILTGTNDFIYGEASPQQAFENLSKMAAMSVSNAKPITPVFMTPLPVNAPMASEKWISGEGIDYNRINDALEALAGLIRSSGFRFIDLNSKYRECGKYLDGVHPLPEGHRFIADIISEYIKRSNTI